jgi:hypothetical protein
LQFSGLCDIALETPSIEDPDGLLAERSGLPAEAETKVKAGQAKHALGHGEKVLLEMEGCAGFRLALPGLREVPLQVQGERQPGQDGPPFPLCRVLEGQFQPILGFGGMAGLEEFPPQAVRNALMPAKGFQFPQALSCFG